MKKRGVKKKSKVVKRTLSKSHAKRKVQTRIQKRENNFIQAVILIIIIAILLAIIGFKFTLTGKAVDDPVTAVVDPIRALFSDWGQGQVSINIAKYMFLILITLLVWSILDSINLFGKGNMVKWVAAAIISFLSTAYITPDEVWLIMTSYSALGSTLLTIIPFMILSFFSYRAVIDNRRQGIVIQWLLWLVFALFLTINIIILIISDRLSSSTGLKVTSLVIYSLVLILSWLAFFFNKSISRFISKINLEAEQETAQTTMARAAENIRNQAAMQQAIGGNGSSTNIQQSEN